MDHERDLLLLWCISTSASSEVPLLVNNLYGNYS